MPWGQITGVRALQWMEEIRGFIKNKPTRLFAAEHMGTLDGHSFSSVVRGLDLRAASKQNAQWRNEHTDAYCLLRDYRYGRRSRKWLMGRHLNNRINGGNDVWATFVRLNAVLSPNLIRIYKHSVNELAGATVNQLEQIGATISRLEKSL